MTDELKGAIVDLDTLLRVVPESAQRSAVERELKHLEAEIVSKPDGERERILTAQLQTLARVLRKPVAVP